MYARRSADGPHLYCQAAILAKLLVEAQYHHSGGGTLPRQLLPCKVSGCSQDSDFEKAAHAAMMAGAVAEPKVVAMWEIGRRGVGLELITQLEDGVAGYSPVGDPPPQSRPTCCISQSPLVSWTISAR